MPASEDIAFEHLRDAVLLRRLWNSSEWDALFRAWYAGASIEHRREILRLLSRVAREHDRSRPGAGSRVLLRRLNLVGGLPEYWERRRARLTDEYETPVEAYEFSVQTGWVPDRSAMSLEQMQVTDPPDIADFLRTWAWPPGFDSPNPRGTGRTLQSEVARRPAEFAAAAERFIGLEPTYVRHLLAGLNEAKERSVLDEWQPVLRVCEWAVSQEERISGTDDWDRDLDWRWTQGTIAELLDFKNGKESAPPLTARPAVWEILSTLARISSGESAVAHDRDFVTMAINSNLGKTTYAVIGYGLWVARNIAEDVGERRMPSEVRSILTELTDSMDQRSILARAAIGHLLPQVCWLDKSWIRDRVSSLFPEVGSRELADSVWDSYLRYGRPAPSTDVFDVVRGQYDRVVSELDPSDGTPPEASGDPRTRVGEHLLVLYMRSEIPFDGVLERYFARAPAAVRRRVLDWLGRDLKDASALDDSVRTRLQTFWDWREPDLLQGDGPKDELLTLTWWCASGLFDTEWLVPRLVRALERAGTGSPHYFYPAENVLERCEAWGPRYLPDCVRILWLVVSHREWNWHRPYIEQATRILRAAEETGDPELHDAVIQITDRMMRDGYPEVEAVLGLG